MRLREHIKYGSVASLLSLRFLGPWYALIFWLASVLIDVDHYIDYVYRTGGTDWRVASIFRLDHFLRQKLQRGELQGRLVCLSLFHTVECFSLIYLAFLWTGSVFWLAVFYGMAFHLFLDVVALAGCRALFVRAFSLIEYVVRRRIMKARGMNPDEVWIAAFKTIGVKHRSLRGPRFAVTSEPDAVRESFEI